MCFSTAILTHLYEIKFAIVLNLDLIFRIDRVSYNAKVLEQKLLVINFSLEGSYLISRPKFDNLYENNLTNEKKNSELCLKRLGNSQFNQLGHSAKSFGLHFYRLFIF